MRNENMALRAENKECTNDLIVKQDKLVKQQADIVSLRTLNKKCDNALLETQNRLVKYQADILSLKEERKDLKAKVEELNRALEELKYEGNHFNKDTKQIFNYVSIEEIEKLRHLFKNKMFDRIKRKGNVNIIQKIAMGLLRRYIPICTPQRTVITDQQRDLIRNIEKSTTNKTEKLIAENIELVSNFMFKIYTSIKMVVQLYDKYGSRDEDTDSDSQDKSSDNNSGDENISTDNKDRSIDKDNIIDNEDKSIDNDEYDNDMDDNVTITNSENNIDSRSTSSDESL